MSGLGVSEKSELERLKAGDPAAWRVLYEREKPALLAQAKRVVRCREDCEEVVQEAWLHAWERRGELEDAVCFLQNEVKNLAWSVRRRRKPCQPYPALVECEEGVFPGDAGEGLVAVEAQELAAPEAQLDEFEGLFAVKPDERFKEQMEERIHAFGAKVLDPAQLKMAFQLWVGKGQSRAKAAAALGLTAKELDRAIKVIVRKLEAAEREAA